MLTMVAGCGSSSTGSHPSQRNDLQTIFEAEPQLHADPVGTLKQLRGLGASRLRVYLPWGAIAPQPKSAARPTGFNASDPSAYPAGVWDTYDRIVRAAGQVNIALDFTIGAPPPLWAASSGAFVAAVAKRFSGSYVAPGSSAPLPRVSFWSIWNEPNYGPELAPQATDHSTVEVAPMLYRNLLDAAWNALHATGHGADKILIGETAPRGLTTGDSPGNFSGMVPLRFLRAMYCADSSFRPLRGSAATRRGCPGDAAGSRQFVRAHPVLFHASGYADHPYPQGLPPNVAAPFEPDYADIATLSRLEQTLDRLQGAYDSSTHMAIYDTEFGYQTNPPEKIARTTDPLTAALYLNWAEYIHWRDPRVRSYDQYQLTDPPSAGATGGFATGLEFKDGTPKATFDAFRMPLYLPRSSGKRGEPLEVWGCVRPAPSAQAQTGKSQQVSIQFIAGSRGSFSTLRTVTLPTSSCYLDVRLAFHGSGAVRLEWSDPSGVKRHSRVAMVRIS
jgi:hypothetical protein